MKLWGSVFFRENVSKIWVEHLGSAFKSEALSGSLTPRLSATLYLADFAALRSG
jgi:hypothetical protein